MEIYNDRGLSGIVNLGNTCYINSVIQSLSHSLPFTDFFLKKEYKRFLKKNKESHFTHEWYRLLNALWEDNCTVSPNSFIKTLITMAQTHNINLNFSEYRQNDFQEFLVFFLDTIHKSLKVIIEVNITGNVKNDIDKLKVESITSWKSHFEKDYSKVIELFYGQMFTEIKDIDTDKTLSRTFQPTCFYMLPLPSGIKNITIYDCLNLYTEEEILDGDNKWYDEKTKDYKKVKKHTYIWDFPKLLILCINRFNKKNQKLDTLVNFPQQLDLTYLCKSNEPSNYELYSVCNHYGSSSGGHYTTLCKNNTNWYKFNDSNVTRIDSKYIVSNNVYCLFYRKI